MRHEAILHDIEAAGPPEARRFVRDSNKYYLSVFGEPDTSTAWGWRVEGHHLSVNYTGIGRTGAGGVARLLRRESRARCSRDRTRGCASSPRRRISRASS